MQMAAGWPVVGRQTELAELLGTVTDPARAGAVLVGAPGVGKSRLAAEVVLHMRRLGSAVTCCYGTAAAAKIQFGAFAAVMADDLSGVSAAGNPLRRAVEILRSRAGGRPLVLVVDDAHLLDDASMALLDQTARHRTCSVLLTAGSHATPSCLVDLYKDGVLARVAVGGLSRDDLDELLGTVLG